MNAFLRLLGRVGGGIKSSARVTAAAVVHSRMAASRASPSLATVSGLAHPDAKAGLAFRAQVPAATTIASGGAAVGTSLT